MSVIFGVAGGLLGNYIAKQKGYTGWKKVAFISACAALGAVAGFVAGEVLVGFIKVFLIANPALLMRISPVALRLIGFSGSVYAVIGSFNNGVGYSNLTQRIGACFFSIPTQLWYQMTNPQQWEANVKFLNNMIAQGKQFLLSNSAYSAQKGTGFWKEIQYLLEHGYKIVDNGFRMIKK